MKLLGAIDEDADVVNKKYVDDKGTTIESAWYCTCSTAASTSAKVLTCSENDFALKIGIIISVAFDHNNTASSVTLNVNSSGAKPIGNRGSQYTGTDPEITGYEGRLLYYVYDGTYWSWLNVFAEEDNSAGSYIPIGTMTMFAGSTPPEGWLICDGSAISRTTYASLFNKIGTTYGAGDGSTTFNIPNFKGRVPVGLDSSQGEFDTLGETGGEKYHTLIASELPSQPNYWGYAGENTDWPIVSNLGLGTQTNCEHYVNVGGTMSSGTTSVYTIRSSGANHPTTHDQAHNNLQPYGVTNIIIRALNTVAEEAPVDSLPIGSILEYDGDTVPEGYSQVADEMVILYSDATGSNTSVTLSDSLANYTYAEIIYRSNDGEGYKNSTGKIWHPNANHVTMTYWFLFGYLYVKYSNAYLDGTSITLTDSTEMYWTSNSFVQTSSNNIYIVCVIGYR